MRGLLFSQNSSACFPGTSLPNIQRQIWLEPHLCFVPGREPSHRQCHPDRSGGICSCFSTLSPPRMPSFPIALTEPLQAAKRRLVLARQILSSSYGANGNTHRADALASMLVAAMAGFDGLRDHLGNKSRLIARGTEFEIFHCRSTEPQQSLPLSRQSEGCRLE